MFARCKLGVLVSVGAATCLSTSPPSLEGSWARRLSQSPELGGRNSTVICFPENQFPKVAWPIELEIAAKVKCPLHGDRFAGPSSRRFHYVSKWLREKTWGIWVRRCSEQYQKAYYASFPSDLSAS
jgi:hypothetical protein